MANPNKGLFKYLPDHKCFLTPSLYTIKIWNNASHLVRMTWLSDDEQIREKQLNASAGLFSRSNDDLRNNPDTKAPLDFFGRPIFPDDICFILGKIDKVPLFVHSTRGKYVVLEDRTTQGRTRSLAKNLIVVTDQIVANEKRKLLNDAILKAGVDID